MENSEEQKKSGSSWPALAGWTAALGAFFYEGSYEIKDIEAAHKYLADNPAAQKRHADAFQYLKDHIKHNEGIYNDKSLHVDLGHRGKVRAVLNEAKLGNKMSKYPFLMPATAGLAAYGLMRILTDRFQDQQR